jgi:hypothetical protein
VIETWIVVCEDGHAAAGPFLTEDEAEKMAVVATNLSREESGLDEPCVYRPLPLFLDTAGVARVILAAQAITPGSQN